MNNDSRLGGPPFALDLGPAACSCGAHDAGAGARSGGSNVAPRATSDFAATAETTPVVIAPLANDTDANGDTLTITRIAGKAVSVGQTITLSSGARVTLNADMTVTYDPAGKFDGLNAGQSALDRFDYRISDGRGGVRTASVTVTIEGVDSTASGPSGNGAPTAGADSATTDESKPVTGNVLANDSDPDGDLLTVTGVNGVSGAVGSTITLPSGAKVAMRADGTYSYDPGTVFAGLSAGQSAVDRFTYTVSDGRGGSASATVSVSIAGRDAVATPYYVQDLLLSDSQRWNAGSPAGTAATVAFAFLASVPSYYASTDWARSQFTALTETQRAVVRESLAEITQVANISFVETADVSKAAITFGFADIPNYAGYAYYPSGTGIGSRAGDVWIDIGFAADGMADGSLARLIAIHEIGHAIGLDHVSTLPSAENNRQHTVMSYNGHPGGAREPETMMLYDVATIQHLYGANRSHCTGDDVYDRAALENRTATVWDAGGVDTFDFSTATAAMTLDLRAGRFSTITTNGARNNVAIADGTMIENAKGGGGADLIVSNASDNVLAGGGGGDTFRFLPDWGRDIVSDFVRGVDRIDLSQTGLGFSALAITTGSAGVTVASGDDSIVLAGLASVSQSDFLFGVVA